MGAGTKVQWCDDTWNGWIGCTKKSTGCLHCYAEADMDKRRHFATWGKNGTRRVTTNDYWKKPFKWNREAQQSGQRRIVFSSSLSDVFEDWDGPMVNGHFEELWVHDCEPYPEPYRYVPMPTGGPAELTDQGRKNYEAGMFRPVKMADVRRRLFLELIDKTPHLTWLLLTKRPENIRKFWPLLSDGGTFRKNVWLYTSVENQEQANRRIPELTCCCDLSPTLGISAEPLLEAVDLREWIHPAIIDHVIVGGESGLDARPFRAEWADDLLEQCRRYDVPFFMKQFGSNPYYGIETESEPKPLCLSDRKGGNPDEWPDGFNVRQMPEKQEV